MRLYKVGNPAWVTLHIFIEAVVLTTISITTSPLLAHWKCMEITLQ